MSDHFSGDQKHLNHFLLAYEQRILRSCLPWVPSWMNTAHLTLLTILWAALIVLFGYLSTKNIYWLWGSSVSIFCQHVTDMLDGEVGRVRKTGLVKWGFYMDHFLDYVFLCAIIVGYSFLVPPSHFIWVLLCLALAGGFMVHVLLDFAVTNDFKISFDRFGVSEIRYVLIVFNILIMLFGEDLLIKSLPFIVCINFLLLGLLVYKSQRVYRQMDQNNLKQEPNENKN